MTALIAIVFAGAALASWLVVGAVIRAAPQLGLVDNPNDRSLHHRPTPRGGGIGIVVACLAVLLAVAATDPLPLPWGLIAIGLVLVAGIGWWDDHRALGALPRLLVHAVAAGLVAYALWLQGADPFTSAAGFVLVVGLVNVWNFMDGIDALAASQALLCGLGLACVLTGAWSALGIAIAGACVGFLPYNLPRARVFLGDVGSGALGYLVAVLLAAGFVERSVAAWPVLLLAPMAMLLDAGLTLAWRVRRGEPWWRPHVQHVFQRSSRRHGHAKVGLAYGLWTLGAIGVMLVLQGQTATSALVVSLSAFAAGGLLWRKLHATGGSATEGFGT